MKKKVILVSLLLALCSVFAVSVASAEPVDPIPNIGIQIGGTGGETGTSSLSIILLITVLSLAPAILVLMTSFTRIVVVLGFVRSSLGTQTMPPNQVLIGLALFLTLFVMSPTLSTVNEVALQPYIKGEITQSEALEKAAVPMKKFMYTHTRTKDLQLFMGYTKMEKPKSYEDIPLSVMVPAFAISELKTAFQMGFMIFIPFLIIDIVVSSVLMAMGMMMLPPSMISLPFKILLFVLVDGWYLVVKSLLMSFNP
ncbi:flagellar type III secretion system pore protein FliP [Paenibacillus macerans]|uniref:flagellar type III secretion system pore protein FliP n=1 Tax=Paenibacillus macerans TaxID=44252 RepID=UPI00203A81C2|nr:flagellar type III secretion system pore protein FliP [Paenibacillus macerans]MCM3699130.1 flagellar type III secretion system pore protein FliP [Paenibacillus macerans]